MHLSDAAENAWTQIARTYVEAGFPSYQVWYFQPLSGEEDALRELEAARLITPSGVGRARYRLDWRGLQRILRDNDISDAALDAMERLGRQWVEAKFPSIRTCVFKTEPGDTTVNELVARGFVEWFASGGQFVLTDVAQDWIMEHRG